jgi:hypothetical protein
MSMVVRKVAAHVLPRPWPKTWGGYNVILCIKGEGVSMSEMCFAGIWSVTWPDCERIGYWVGRAYSPKKEVGSSSTGCMASIGGKASAN